MGSRPKWSDSSPNSPVDRGGLICGSPAHYLLGVARRAPARQQGCNYRRSRLDWNCPRALPPVSGLLPFRRHDLDRPPPRYRQTACGRVQFCPCGSPYSGDHREGTYSSDTVARRNLAFSRALAARSLWNAIQFSFRTRRALAAFALAGRRTLAILRLLLSGRGCRCLRPGKTGLLKRHLAARKLELPFRQFRFPAGNKPECSG